MKSKVALDSIQSMFNRMNEQQASFKYIVLYYIQGGFARAPKEFNSREGARQFAREKLKVFETIVIEKSDWNLPQSEKSAIYFSEYGDCEKGK